MNKSENKGVNNMVTIPFIVHESECNRLERINAKYFKLTLLLTLIICSFVIGLLVYLCIPSEITSDQSIQDVETIDNSNINNR